MFNCSRVCVFSNDLWIVDLETGFDMCIFGTLGFRLVACFCNWRCIPRSHNYQLHRRVARKGEFIYFDGLILRLLVVCKRCRRDGSRYCWEPFDAKYTYTDPNSIYVPIVCLPDSDVAVIVFTASHLANNCRSKL